MKTAAAPPPPRQTTSTDIADWIKLGEANPERAAECPILAELKALSTTDAKHYETLRARVKAAGYCMFERFDDVADLERVLSDLDHRDSGDVVILLGPRADHNGALTPILKQARVDYPGKRIVYEEWGTDSELLRAIARQSKNPSRHVVPCGHAYQFGIAGGAGWITYGSIANPLVAEARKGIAKGCEVVCRACDVGSHFDGPVNIVNILARMFNRARVVGSPATSHGLRYEGKRRIYALEQSERDGYAVGPLDP